VPEKKLPGYVRQVIASCFFPFNPGKAITFMYRYLRFC